MSVQAKLEVVRRKHIDIAKETLNINSKYSSNLLYHMHIRVAVTMIPSPKVILKQ